MALRRVRWSGGWSQRRRRRPRPSVPKHCAMSQSSALVTTRECGMESRRLPGEAAMQGIIIVQEEANKHQIEAVFMVSIL